MEHLHILLVFGFLTGFNGAQNISRAQSPSYLVSISRAVRPGIPTIVSVTNLRDSPVSVISELKHGNSSIQTRSTIEAGWTKMQVLPAIPENHESYWFPYELTVRGYMGEALVFSNSTMLQYNPKTFTVLLQTDKTNYKPGQTVKIRAVLLTPDGRPNHRYVDLLIMDPRRNIVHQWLSVETVLGTVSREFQLSENPPLGQWTIVASVNDTTQDQAFNVSHYVLPKFEVVVEAPEVLYFKDHLVYAVNARYLSGKPVMGRLAVTYIHGFQGIEEYYEDIVTMIHGTADLSFDIGEIYQNRSDDYRFHESSGDFILINAQVTEHLTGVTHNSTVTIPIAMNRFKLEFLPHPPAIRPSLNYSAKLKLSTYDKHPLTLDDQNGTVSLTVTQHTLSPWTMGQGDLGSTLMPDIQPNFTLPYPFRNTTLELPITADGIIAFSTLLSDNVASLSVEAEYEDAYISLHLNTEYTSPSKSYINIQTKGHSRIGQPFTLTVESNFPLTQFHYMVTSQGQIVDAGTLGFSVFTLTPDVSWAPVATVLVYCIRPDGEIITDALDLSFTQTLRNNVSLSWGTKRAGPANTVSMDVSVSEPESLVGMLVVDKGTLDKDRTNDITEKKVTEELMKFFTDLFNSPSDEMLMSDPYSIFRASGVTVLTDAELNPVYDIWPMIRPEFPGEGDQLFLLEHEPHQRMNFPETWLWMDISMNMSTTASLELTVPDSLTSWVATAFVISENLGLGISAPAELEVFKDFFLSLNLPAFIIRGELLLLEVSLFNYMDMDQEVLVEVNASSMFEFVSPGTENTNMRRVLVLSQNSTAVLFPIKAVQLGEIPISIKATSIHAHDSVQQTILVKPEGMEQSFTQTLFLEFPLNKLNLSRELEFKFPGNVVPGSQRAMVTAVGDILGPSISGLDTLIQMPYGCGEQNMINFAPNIYVLQYLSSTGRTDEEIRSRAITFMTQGYERELSYQREDGSFSAFGNIDPAGSTWLTSFVLRCFLQARQFIFIDGEVLMRTTNWLRAQQREDGSFLEPGRVIHTELQGGLDGSVSLTAYVLMALLEDVEHNAAFAGQVSKAINYLTNKLQEGISSNYSLCLVTYALSLANSPYAITALTELMNRAHMKDDVPMWSSQGSGLSVSWQPRSVDIEMGAYTLLSFYTQGSVEQGFSLMKWLSKQRNHLGGYGSTQDTVIALQALSAYATLSSVEYIDLNITVTDPKDTVAFFTINQRNYLVYQSQEINATGDIHMQVSAVGRGFALLQLTVFYNTESTGLSRRRREFSYDPFYEDFDLDIYVMDYQMYKVDLDICFRLSEWQELNQTGMAILDVGLLTGFSVAEHDILISDLVRRVETYPGKIILYLDSVSKMQTCVYIPTSLEFKVASVQDAVVTLYDYYEPQRKTVRTYTSEAIRDQSVCHLCGDDCSLCSSDMVSVYDSAISSRQQHCLLQLLALVLFLTLAFCF